MLALLFMLSTCCHLIHTEECCFVNYIDIKMLFVDARRKTSVTQSNCQVCSPMNIIAYTIQLLLRIVSVFYLLIVHHVSQYVKSYARRIVVLYALLHNHVLLCTVDVTANAVGYAWTYHAAGCSCWTIELVRVSVSGFLTPVSAFDWSSCTTLPHKSCHAAEQRIW
jgi:hypothetical protein